MNLLRRVSSVEIDQKLNQLHQRAEAMDRRLGEIAKTIEDLAGQLSRDAVYGLLVGERTSDVRDTDQQKQLLRTFPGKIFNHERPCTNAAFAELLKQADGNEVPEDAWQKILADTLVEASSVPGAAQVFERQAHMEDYLNGLARKFHARYAPGWVNLDEALFLYWLVRQTKPSRIVQCGSFNGRSSAFMMLALAKNGQEGALKIIDQPPVFDPANPAWTVEGKTYGTVVPAGKTSAWMVPDRYRDRLQIWNGEVHDLLPKAVDDPTPIDLFYYASDHDYRQMMWAFERVRPRLPRGGLVVATDVGWNASLWDFAERCGVPSYTFKGAVGVGFF